MKIPFRHGIVRYQTDTAHNPAFLTYSSSTNIVSIQVNPDPTIIAIAHGTTDYLFEESVTTKAWVGPFPTNKTVWLYWDIDVITGARTYGYTQVEPMLNVRTAPLAPIADQHWFDPVNVVMQVWNGSVWQERLRVFAGKVVQNSMVVAYPLGTQVGISGVDTFTGTILFDEDGKPVKKWDRNNRGKFITTETPLSSQFPKIATFKLETGLTFAKAVEYIPKWACVCYKGPNQIGVAKPILPSIPAVGIAAEDLYLNENRGFHTGGFFTDPMWNWQEPGAALFVGQDGRITTSVSQHGSVQRIGQVIDSMTILVDIGPQLRYA